MFFSTPSAQRIATLLYPSTTARWGTAFTVTVRKPFLTVTGPSLLFGAGLLSFEPPANSAVQRQRAVTAKMSFFIEDPPYDGSGFMGYSPDASCAEVADY